MPTGFRYDQPTGAGAGIANKARTGIWLAQAVQVIDTGSGGAPSYEFEKPGDSGATLVGSPPTFTPDVPGTYGVTQTRDGLSLYRVIRVTKDAAGVDLVDPLPLPGFREQEDHSDGITGQGPGSPAAPAGRGWSALFEAFRAKLLSVATTVAAIPARAVAPTPDTVAVRTAQGGGRFVQATLETNTDADRVVKATQADGTTLAMLRCDATKVRVCEAGTPHLDLYQSAGASYVESPQVLICKGTSVNIETATSINLVATTTLSLYGLTGATLATTTGGILISPDDELELRPTTGTVRFGNTAATSPLSGFFLTGTSATLEAAQDADFTLSQAQKTSGAGRDMVFQAQAGASGSANGKLKIRLPSGNTALGGKLVWDVGTAVSNVSDPVEIQVAGTKVLGIFQNAASSVLIQAGTDSTTVGIGGSAGASGNSLTIIPSSYTTLVAASGYLLVGGTVPHYTPSKIRRDGPANQEEFILQDNALPTTATSGNILTHASLTGATFKVDGEAICHNTTDGTGAEFVVTTPGLYRNVGGTITTLRAAVITATGDAGDTGNVTIGLSFSGATLQFTYSTANAKTRRISGKLSIRYSP